MYASASYYFYVEIVLTLKLLVVNWTQLFQVINIKKTKYKFISIRKWIRANLMLEGLSVPANFLLAITIDSSSKD
jgi:hypothetical protein